MATSKQATRRKRAREVDFEAEFDASSLVTLGIPYERDLALIAALVDGE